MPEEPRTKPENKISSIEDYNANINGMNEINYNNCVDFHVNTEGNRNKGENVFQESHQ